MWERNLRSRYNQFKIRYSSRNNIYMIYKNMPLAQLFLNLPFLVVGFGVKLLFFTVKGYGREYAAGIKNGFALSRKGKKYPFHWKNIGNYCRIQGQFWWIFCAVFAAEGVLYLQRG